MLSYILLQLLLVLLKQLLVIHVEVFRVAKRMVLNLVWCHIGVVLEENLLTSVYGAQRAEQSFLLLGNLIKVFLSCSCSCLLHLIILEV